MKILKSGIEMTPEELTKIHGGRKCACGCLGMSSGSMWVQATSGGDCYCGCVSPRPPNNFTSPYTSAQDYPY